MATLSIVSGGLEGRNYVVDRDNVTIGRAGDNAIPIDDPSVSGHHAVIERSGRRFVLRDLGSTNGTRLNGVKVDEIQLSPGDIFSIGSINLSIGGDDIEGQTQQEIPPTVIHAPVEPAPPNGSSAPQPSEAFQAKKGRGGVVATVVVALVVILVVLLGVFVVRLFL